MRPPRWKSQHGQRAGQGRARGGRAGGTHKEQGLWSLTRKGKEGAHERGQTTGEGDWPRHSIHVWAAGPAKKRTLGCMGGVPARAKRPLSEIRPELRKIHSMRSG